MRSRSVSYTLLAASGAAVLVALVVLVFQVRSEGPTAAVDPAVLARAAERAQGGAQRGDRPAERSSGAAAPVSATAPTLDAERPQRPTDERLRLGWSGLRRELGARNAAAQAVAHAEDAVRPPEVIPPPPDVSTGGEAPAADDGSGPNQAAISEVVDLYDAGDYENARARAIQVLDLEPTNERILRIATSTSCLMGDVDQARAFYQRLTPIGQRQMARRCRRYGVEL